jgi:Fic family protein
MNCLVEKIIGGRKYYYMGFSLTKRSDGERVIVSQYIGPNPPPDPGVLLERLFNEVGDVAAASTDPKGVSPLGRDAIRRVEKARFLYQLLHQEPFMADLERFRRLFTVLFILNSNRVEGTLVTRPDIERMMERRRTPKSQLDLEISNSLEAMAYAFSKEMKWSGPGVKKVHELLFRNLWPQIAGKYKKVDNIVGTGQDPVTSETVPWKEVPRRVIELMKWFRAARTSGAYPPWLAIELYWRFERIHPFEDGNGRVGRILMNAVLQSSGFMPVIFDANRATAHSTAIVKAINGNVRYLGDFLGEHAKWTVSAIEKYREVAKDSRWRRPIPEWWRTKRTRLLSDDVGRV